MRAFSCLNKGDIPEDMVRPGLGNDEDIMDDQSHMTAYHDHHCHLDAVAFDDDRDDVVARARALGVTHCTLAATVREHWPRVIETAHRYGFDYQLGLHPYFMDQHRLEGAGHDIDALADLLAEFPRDQALVGIGECGVDKRFPETLKQQWALFEAQLQLAKAYRLPVVIHCVRLYDEVAKRLRELQLPAGGIVHGFIGSVQQAQRFVALGFRVGIGGAITWPRNERLRRVVAALPAEAIALESDAPDMPLWWPETQRPQWLRSHNGRDRNEPCMVARLAEQVAALQAGNEARHPRFPE